MQEKASYVVIGNGITGVTAAEILRAEDAAADITVVADDPFPVYYRPALKDYLAGRVREDKLWARPNSFYQAQRIRFLAERVVGIQAGQHTVQLQNGKQLPYSRLLLANGARANRLTCPGANLPGVMTLRTVADYQEVVGQLGTVRRVVVSGSGTLALETIETLRHRGYNVTHLLRRKTLWSEVLDATSSDLVLQQERRDGVDARLEDEIAEISGKNGRVSGVVTTSGAHIACEMVIVAIGIDPIIDFIKASGIPCGRGVKVDEAMRTSAPDIYAAGDVLETTDPLTGRVRVIGQWYPAVQQGRAASYSMLGLLDTGHPFRSSTFYNATFLYGLDFASVGLTQVPRDSKGYQELVADPQARIYRKVLLKDGVPVGALSLGDRKGTLALKRAIDHKVNLTPVLSRLFAGDFKLVDWLDKQGVPPALLGVSREGNAAVRQAAYAGGTMAATVLKAQPLIEAFLIPDAPGAEKADLSGETPLSQTKVISIGRQAGAYLLVDNNSVSRRHAEISYANGQYVLRDLASSNGTFVNEKRLASGSTHVLKHHDRIRFGQVPYLFIARSAGKQEARAATEAALPAAPTAFHQMLTGFYDPASAGQAPPPQGQPILNADGSLLLPGAAEAIFASVVDSFKSAPALILVGHGKPVVYHLKQGRRLKLGRDKSNDIVLADAAASRLHAEVFHGSDGYYIRDLGSVNGVVVNNTKIDNPYRLAHGDRVSIGSITLYFISVESEPGAQAAPAAPATVQCSTCGTENPRAARFCANCGAPVGQAAEARA